MKTSEETTILSQVSPAVNGSARPATAVGQVRCSGCGQPMATDQRYCLECGSRRGGPRLEFGEYLGERGEAGKPGLPTGTPPPPPVMPGYSLGGADPDPRPVREVTPLMAAAGLMAFALILIFGVLIGKQGNGGGTQAPIVAATGLPGPAATGSSTTTDVNVSFQADWPADKEGFTIELATLSKEGTDPATVESTKTELSGQGASEVGVLDSDEFGSLPGGNYVFYSGEFDTRPDAQKALASLQASFPDAQVIEVAAEAGSLTGGNGDNGGSGGDGGGGGPAPVEASQDDLEQIEDLPAEEYQEQLKKLPTEIGTEGPPPEKDNKAPGGGDKNAVEIG